ncbi:hypothetical protein [Candidatus Mycoplasma haematohominis]|uniref:Uncharacterized protein n=1 Tax=Candidatus Mycoplasma haematohominis TaxID=1494318 RepID=A0A478FPW6_9MOLU|nr:hypothetical protein [Candidatus Mycoplasma haemohominis]GCE63097.1 hypothetical protein MHSWG343_00750 [Candidatus Mycoplasma haemohominis]
MATPTSIAAAAVGGTAAIGTVSVATYYAVNGTDKNKDKQVAHDELPDTQAGQNDSAQEDHRDEAAGAGLSDSDDRSVNVDENLSSQDSSSGGDLGSSAQDSTGSLAAQLPQATSGSPQSGARGETSSTMTAEQSDTQPSSQPQQIASKEGATGTQ